VREFESFLPVICSNYGEKNLEMNHSPHKSITYLGEIEIMKAIRLDTREVTISLY